MLTFRGVAPTTYQFLSHPDDMVFEPATFVVSPGVPSKLEFDWSWRE